jgi:hypothetical protein
MLSLQKIWTSDCFRLAEEVAEPFEGMPLAATLMLLAMLDDVDAKHQHTR